jgi:large subunit ribosomal protein L17
MNSRTNISKVGIKASHRKSLQKNLLSDLIIYEHLTTSKPKSKLVIGEFDKLISIVKSEKSDLYKRRLLTQKLGNENAVEKLLAVYAKRYEKETSGFVKLYNLHVRKGDATPMVKMMVKGYVYKDIGKKVAKTEKKEVKTEAKEAKKLATKDLSANAQVAGNVSASKIKTRSGI